VVNVLLFAVVLVMVATNVATNRLPQRWYLPVCVLGTALLLTLARLDGLSAADLGLGRGTILPGLLWAALIMVLVGGVYAAAAGWPRTRGAFADRRAMESSGQAIATRALIVIPFGTVLLEETAFRGVLFGMLSDRHGTAWAVVGSSLLFGLWHILPAGTMHAAHDGVSNVLGRDRRGRVLAVLSTVAFTAAGGFVFALLRLWTDSLLPPIGLHWALNGFGVVVAWWLGQRARSAPPPP
jgi:membrane protease YdiL (CAAX protease family)